MLCFPLDVTPQAPSDHHGRGFWNSTDAKDTRQGIGLQEVPSNGEAKGACQGYIKATSKWALLISEWSGQ